MTDHTNNRFRFLSFHTNTINGKACLKIRGVLLTQEVIDLVIEELKLAKPDLPHVEAFLQYSSGDKILKDFTQ